MMSDDPTRLVRLGEWSRATATSQRNLRDTSLRGDLRGQRIAETLQHRLDIREGYSGLEVNSTSFVGCLDVGPLRISIEPKLSGLPLMQLLRYAYGLSDLTVFGSTETSLTQLGFQDLLILMLANETERLTHGRLVRHYVPVLETLETPRGKILVDQVIRRGGMLEAKLPCRFFERRLDWTLNQVMRAGLNVAASLAIDREVRHRLLRLESFFESVVPTRSLKIADLDKVESALTRMTSAYQPALSIVRLLLGGVGPDLALDDESGAVPGFLFDMNRFFQRLVSKFMRENAAGFCVHDETPIRNVFTYSPIGNARSRRALRPRPDFALYKGQSLLGFLDAKYRDIWSKGCPPNWLYQLSIYALASRHRTSILLYASMSDNARDERIEIRQPVHDSTVPPATVILRPVPLVRLADIVGGESQKLAVERTLVAERLVQLEEASWLK